MKWTLAVILVGLSASGCVREQPKPETHPLAAQRQMQRGPIQQRDLAGAARTLPRPTMGALEAENDRPSRSPTFRR